jgi:polyferredoxin
MRRRVVQAASSLLANANLPGFIEGRLYQGRLKSVCVPVLNCYSCPGALGACPVGSFQSLAAGFSRTASLYVVGFLTAVGAVGGRFTCGWFCPFGFLQELLHRLSPRRLALPRFMELLKYPVLALTVLLPFFWRDAVGLAEPYYCKYICPAGTLEAGLPLVGRRPELAALIGPLFWLKVCILAALTISALFVWRPFCRTLCPLGAFFGFFNRLSLWQLRVDRARCTSCGTCARRCPAGLHPYRDPNPAECVRCLECTRVCPAHALTFASGAKAPALTSLSKEA